MSKLQGKLTVKRLAGLVQAVPGQATGKLQEKTVTPSTEEQTVTPDGGYAGMNRVYVEAVQLQAKSVEPSTSAQVVTPDAEYMGLSQVYVGAAPLQQKTATPAAEAQEITPDAGYYGLEKVAVEAAPLQEITITPTSEVQTITPDTDEGYIGFSKITVEAVEYDDSGGDSGGGGSGDVGTYPSSSGVAFGSETVTEEVETGNYQYGDEIVISKIPENDDFPFRVVSNHYSAAEYAYRITVTYYSVFPSYYDAANNRFYFATQWKVYNRSVITGNINWFTSPVKTNNPGYSEYTSMVIHWSNWNFVDQDGTTVQEFEDPIPETKTETYEQFMDVEDEYLISGDTLNDIASAAQKVTGNETMTPEQIAAALNAYANTMPKSETATE